MTNIFSIMNKIEKLKQGISVKISDSEIVSIIINLSDAKKNLDQLSYIDLYSVYKNFSKETIKVEYDFESYKTRCKEIIESFEIVAPYEAYNGEESIDFKRKLINVSPQQFILLFYKTIFQDFTFSYILKNCDTENKNNELGRCDFFAIKNSVSLLSMFLPKIRELNYEELGRIDGYCFSNVCYELGLEESFINELFDLECSEKYSIFDFFTNQNILNFGVFEIQNIIIKQYKYLLKNNNAIRNEANSDNIIKVTNDRVNIIEVFFKDILHIRNELLKRYSIVL